jgi:hypothetical protein
MIAGLVRIVSTVATALVVLGFALFAIDETRAGSQETVARLDGAPKAVAERDARAEEHSGLRGAVDDANDVLLAPFEGLGGGSSNAWVRNGVPALLGFLFYGLLLRLLANALPKPRHETLGWETPR